LPPIDGLGQGRGDGGSCRAFSAAVERPDLLRDALGDLRSPDGRFMIGINEADLRDSIKHTRNRIEILQDEVIELIDEATSLQGVANTVKKTVFAGEIEPST